MIASTRLRFSQFLATVVALACVATMTTAANALPGQRIATFAAWAHTKTTLRGLTRKQDEMSGWPAYDLTMSDHGVAWHFRAQSDGTTIRSESLSVGSDGTTVGDPIRHDGSGYGFTFWTALYGPSIAADYRSSVAVFRIRAAPGRPETTYYRGKLFGYVSAGDVRIETLALFAPDVTQAKTCVAHPTDCPGD